MLLTIWPRLGEWLAADRDALRLRRRISLAARAWDAREREPDRLLHRAAARAGAAARRRPRSRAQRRWSAPSSRRASSTRPTTSATGAGGTSGCARVFAVVAVLALVASLVRRSTSAGRSTTPGTDQDAAEDGPRPGAVAPGRRPGRQAAGDVAVAGRCSSRSRRYDLAPTVEARSRLLLGLTGGTQVSRLVGPEGPMRAVARPGRAVIATVHSDGVIRFWSGPDDAAPTLVADLAAAEGGAALRGRVQPGRAAVRRGGRRPGSSRSSTSATPRAPVAWTQPLTGPGATVQDLAFSRDGRTLYAATSDPALVRWSLRKGEQAEPLRTVTRFGGAVQSVATSSTGLVATGSADGTVRVWELPGRRGWSRSTSCRWVERDELRALRGLLARRPAPRGRRARTGSSGCGDAGTGSLVTDQLGGFTLWVNAVAFCPDGLSLAAGAFGGWCAACGASARGSSRAELCRARRTSPRSSSLRPGTSCSPARSTVAPGSTASAGPSSPPFGDDIRGLAAPAAGDPGLRRGRRRVTPRSSRST